MHMYEVSMESNEVYFVFATDMEDAKVQAERQALNTHGEVDKAVNVHVP